MQFEFKSQRIKDSITTGDEIEIYNSEDGGMNGDWTVADVDPSTGDVTLVGKGIRAGYISVVCMGGAE